MHLTKLRGVTSQKTLILIVHFRLPPTNIPVTVRGSYSAASDTLLNRSEHIALWDNERIFEHQYICGIFVKKALVNSNMCFSLQ